MVVRRLQLLNVLRPSNQAAEDGADSVCAAACGAAQWRLDDCILAYNCCQYGTQLLLLASWATWVHDGSHDGPTCAKNALTRNHSAARVGAAHYTQL